MKKLACMMMMVCLSTIMFAQNPENKKRDERTVINPTERIEARVQRMQQQLLLDDEQGAKFAKIYKEYLQAQLAARPEHREALKTDPKERKPLTDQQMMDRQKQRLEHQKKMAALKETYYNKLSKVLNARQLEQVFFAQKQGKGRFDKHKGMKRNHPDAMKHRPNRPSQDRG